MIRSTSCGLTAPLTSCWPTSTRSPSPTSSRARREIGYSRSSLPSSGVTTTRLVDAHPAGRLGDRRDALGHPRLEQLTDTGQTVGDVLTRDTTGVEGTHGQLRAGLTDRLGGDDADRLADVDDLARRQRPAVAG